MYSWSVTTITEKSAWAPRPDTFLNGSSGRNYPKGRRDQGGFNRANQDNGVVIGRPTDDQITDDSIGWKLDRVLDSLDKFESWREETDRKFDTIDPTATRFQDIW